MKKAALAFLPGLVVLMVGTMTADAQIVPVALDNSGFNTDAILEGDTGSYSGDLSGSGFASSYVLVTADYATAHSDVLDPNGALPQNGVITSPSTGAEFQLQPYDESNVLVLNETTGTLTLAPSAQSAYTELSFLVSNLRPANRSSTVSFTLYYTDGQSLTLTTSSIVQTLTSAPSPDGEAAITLDSYLFNYVDSSSPIYLTEYDFSIPSSSQILQSITIDPGTNLLDVYAVSGVDPAPEPQTWALLLAGAGALVFLARVPALRA